MQKRSGVVNDRFDDRQQGQSLIIIAVVLIVLLIFAAVAVDLANAYVHRRTDQNAADAAAMAGARNLVKQLNDYGVLIGLYGSEATIKQQMNDFAERNGAPDSDGVLANTINTNVVGYYLAEDGTRASENVIGSTGIIHPNARGVEAVVQSVAPSFFSGVMGLDGISIDAEAAVLIEGGVCSAGCVAPIATLTTTFEFSPTCYNLWDGWKQTEAEAGSGNFGWLNFSWQGNGHSCKDVGLPDDCSVGCLEYNLTEGTCLSGVIHVNEWVGGAVGVMNANQIRDELEYFINNNIPVTVIIYDIIQGSGCGKSGAGTAYRVKGFAKFQPTGYMLAQGSGSSYDRPAPNDPDELWADPDTCADWGAEGNRITGFFIEWVDLDGGGDCSYFGIVGPHLVK